MRNVWIRIAIIALATFLTTLLFHKFESNKMDENLQKFLKIDKYKKELHESQAKKEANLFDSAASSAYKTAKEKLDKALPNYNRIAALLVDYDEFGAKKIAKKAYESGWLNDIEASRLKDDVRNANDYLVLEARSVEDNKIKTEFNIAKEVTEKYKEPLKKYFKKELTLDSTITALNAIYPILEINKEKVKNTITGFSIEKALAKDIEKADNSTIVWGIILSSILFCIVRNGTLTHELHQSPDE